MITEYSQVENFSNLLKILTALRGEKLSVGTELKISRLCKKSKNREELSKKIIQLLQEMKTEAELIEKLDSLAEENQKNL